ncbi:MAG: S-layer homology domain-containing protein [Clostridia bacterium]|nr:S-layer homology domain-containing protein [Clostridia bacterium]
MKKCIVLVMICLLACVSVNASKTSKFAYVDMTNHWAEESAVTLAEKDIYVGTKINDNYYFNPDETLTRTEFLIMLVSALGLETKTDVKVPFEDFDLVPEYAKNYILTAYSEGLIDGNLEYGKLYLRPYDVLTRIEIIKIIDKVIKCDSDEKAKYNDMYLVPKWGEQAVSNLTKAGILKGYEDGTVRPYVKINRATASEFILKTVK